MKKSLFILLYVLLAISGKFQPADWQTFMAKQDLVWNNTVDSGFFNGAFIGDGFQGAMIYLANKNPADYAATNPPKPVLTTQGDINLVINKMKSQGAHVVASQLIKEADNTQILYVAIGTSDNMNTTIASTEATSYAVKQIQAAVSEGYLSITARHQDWWHKYMQTSYLQIDEEPYWQKFWYIQLYKFASASSQNSYLIMDTQGTWIWQAAWAAIWWNMNVQLSYVPMYSANKLDVGLGFITGMNRMYESGVLKQNAGGLGINIGRKTTYDGNGNWGDEYGNFPWLLQMYWRYWNIKEMISLERHFSL